MNSPFPSNVLLRPQAGQQAAAGNSFYGNRTAHHDKINGVSSLEVLSGESME
jgi:hypothetical protein